MPIEMPRGLPFSVDTFSSSSMKKRHHFLTHAHKDHTAGISSRLSFPIYSTYLTKILILQHYTQLDDSLFLCIEVGQSMVINDPDGDFRVTAFDANHCPGAVMFLFEGNFGNILHTGDCRLTPECLRCLPEKYVGRKGKEPGCRLDYIFLDCTFGKFSQRLPSKHSAISQVTNCIWKHPDAPVVYLACDLLGQEDILIAVSKTFGSKIFVDKVANPEYFQSLMFIAPGILSEDPSSRFQLFEGFPKLYERAAKKLAEARSNFQPEPLIIRPSSQWYACDEKYSESGTQRKLHFHEAVRDEFGVWHVCYSIHSSREELEWALQLLMPKRVVSTTTSCRAMELDYARKNCFGARITSDDTLWKLLDIDVKPSQGVDVLGKDMGCDFIAKGPAVTSETQMQAVIASSSTKELLTWSPPSKRLCLTLFGRARIGIEDPNCAHGEKKTISVKEGSPQNVSSTSEELLILETNAEVREKSKLGDNMKINVTAAQCRGAVEKEVSEGCTPFGIGYSKGFGENLRKLYRSMNVPVPRPLPSLVELMNSSKRSRRKFEF